jgi:hypothetical protein
MGNAIVAVDAGFSAFCHRFVCTGCHRWLLRECHDCWGMTAMPLGGVVRFELRPNLLRERQSMALVLCGRVEFSGQVSSHLSARLNVPHEARKE